MSFAKLPLDFVIPANKVLAGESYQLVLYRDQLCPGQQNPPPSPRVIRVLDHGGRTVPPGTWDVEACGDQHVEWRAFAVTYSGDEHSLYQQDPAGVRLFAAFFEQTTIEIELCMAGHEDCADAECQRRDNLILKLGARAS